MPITKVLLIEDKDISRNDETWSEADAVPGIKNVHVMKAVPNQDLLFSSAQTSFPKSIPASSVPPAADAEQTFKENDCVLVKYDSKTYPGIVTAVVGSDVEVSVMKKAGSTSSGSGQ